ncbi:MAG: serine O-acetyltransferase [Chloroflexi bacterium]|nr:serine O-acetyltransferase [Chloroflexota bacterium]
MFGTLREDIRTVFNKDPAARNWVEVICCYPGLQALWSHRFAHFFWRHQLRLLARIISQNSRFFTGVEIHPGAKIGRRFFIDHGMGVVIGETSEIGDDCLLYQGVVLGGTTFEKKKRHPTLGNNVVIGSAAILLGPITIGEGGRIGANSVVVKSVPPGKTVVGVPGRIVGQKEGPIEALEHGKLPDPIIDAIRRIITEQAKLVERISKLEQTSETACSAEEARLLEIVLGKSEDDPDN